MSFWTKFYIDCWKYAVQIYKAQNQNQIPLVCNQFVETNHFFIYLISSLLSGLETKPLKTKGKYM